MWGERGGVCRRTAMLPSRRARAAGQWQSGARPLLHAATLPGQPDAGPSVRPAVVVTRRSSRLGLPSSADICTTSEPSA